jgi:hypothetical protein
MESIDDFQHPLYEPYSILFDTYALNKLHENITRWLWTGCTGAYVTGSARTGKTTALNAIQYNMVYRDNTLVPVHRVTIPMRDKPTITSVFRTLCISAELKVTAHSKTDELSARFIEYLLDKTYLSKSKRLVLIVDEMQRLTTKQFQAFAEIYDVLKEYKVALLTIFVGNTDESLTLIGELKEQKNRHISGRFFTHHETFEGLMSKQEVAHCLKQYDTTRYPLPNGPTYTGYFLVDEFKNGWRLENLSGEIWRAFHHYQQQYKISSWGMQYFLTTINTLLLDYLPNLDLNDIDSKVFDECIIISGLIPSLVRH